LKIESTSRIGVSGLVNEAVGVRFTVAAVVVAAVVADDDFFFLAGGPISELCDDNLLWIKTSTACRTFCIVHHLH